MYLNNDSKQQLRIAIKFVKEIYCLFFQAKQRYKKTSTIQIDPMTQNAIMFCFKMIAKHLELASKISDPTFQFELDMKNMPPEVLQQHFRDYYPEHGGTLKFWENLHILRNRLVHSFYNNMHLGFKMSEHVQSLQGKEKIITQSQSQQFVEICMNIV